jgi:hypothetical protein
MFFKFEAAGRSGIMLFTFTRAEREACRLPEPEPTEIHTGYQCQGRLGSM